MWNKLVFTGDEWYQSVVTTTRFEKGRLAEIRLHPIDLNYTARGADRGVPRLATPEVAKVDPRTAATAVAAVRHDHRHRAGHRRHPSGVAAGDRGETVVLAAISSPRVPLLSRMSAPVAGLSVAAALVSGCGGPNRPRRLRQEVRRPESRRRRGYARMPGDARNGRR